MSQYKPSGKRSGIDPKVGEKELKQITKRSANALRRLAELDKDWDHLATAIDQWATKHNLEAAKAALMLRLVLLPIHLHEVEFNQPSDAANEYGELETRATNLLLRKRALEAELVAIHNEFHAWARKYGAELITETRDSEMDLAAARLSGAFGPTNTTLPPGEVVLNSIRCESIGNTRWKTTRHYCRIKTAIE